MQEVVAREEHFGVNSAEVEEAVDFLIDYEEINAAAIASDIRLTMPRRGGVRRLTEDDFAPAPKSS